MVLQRACGAVDSRSMTSAVSLLRSVCVGVHGVPSAVRGVLPSVGFSALYAIAVAVGLASRMADGRLAHVWPPAALGMLWLTAWGAGAEQGLSRGACPPTSRVQPDELAEPPCA